MGGEKGEIQTENEGEKAGGGRGDYVPRAQRYNHLLDSAYDDIRKTAAETADAIEGSRKGASQNFLQPEEEEQPTPAVSDIDDDDEQAFMQV